MDKAHYDANTKELICAGQWDIRHLPAIKATLQQISWPPSGTITIVGKTIEHMDSAGAWLLVFWQTQLSSQGLKVVLQDFSKEQLILLELVSSKVKEETKLPQVPVLTKVETVGKATIQQWMELKTYLAFIGKLSMEVLRLLPNPARWRWAAFAGVIYRNGFLALPIIALLSFLIGIVLTYQMGLQLKNYGANIFIVNLLGLAVLREFGPLLTAIMVAGRTGSSFTAQLGMMKLNQEIDALDTMGVTPAELLLLPRIFGLFISLPLLAMWSDIFGILGGMVMANSMLNITWYDFLHRFPTVIPLRAFLIGIGKAPVFALLIASIGCFQGIQVEGSAESVGRNTTRSVVLSIFFIIVADAIFSIIFSKLKL